MSGARKFLFGEDFGSPTVAPDAPDPCAAAVADAFRRGVEEGRTEAARTSERLLAGALDLVGQGLAAGLGQLDAVERSVEADAFSFFEALARAIAGEALADRPLAPLASAADAAFRHLRGVPHLALRVNDALVEPADALLARMARERGYEGRIIVLGDPALSPGDARFEWADGGATRDRRALDAAVAGVVAAARPRHPSEDPA